MAADGAATLMSHGLMTAQQRSMRKLATNGCVLTGFAGHMGLAQRIRGEIERMILNGSCTGEPDQAVQMMRRRLWNEIVELEMRAVQSTHEAFRGTATQDSAIAEILCASIFKDRPELIHFDEKCAPTICTDDIPFVCIGAGQQMADPFLAFIRRVLWPGNCLPSIAEGTFSVLWTLHHVIHTSPAGIGDPVQLATLERRGGDWIARELSADELIEHRDRVRDAEALLRDWGAGLGASGVIADIPKPPQ